MTRSREDLLGIDPSPQANPFIVNSNDLARVLGITTRTVNKMAADGTIPRAGRARFDLVTAVPAYVAFKERPTTDEDKARKAKADADLAEAKAAKIRGELLDASEVESTWAAILRDVKAAMLAIPSRLDARLPHAGKEVSHEADRAIRDALTNLGGIDNEN